MKTKILILTILTTISQHIFSQSYPTFGPEIKVTINGLTFDAMEPLISPDGNTLFFNSLNSVDTTNLYYASRINDSTFNFVGIVGGTLDTSANHLDAVPSIDSLSNFYWTSLRDFPTQTETIHRGLYSIGNVNNISKVYGTFNIYQSGWLVFDAAINIQGDKLYYSNAFFNNCAFGAPCIANLGVAQKVNDTVFNKMPNSDFIFSNINDTNYITYAPQITMDGLEIYFTRLLKGGTNTEICVSVRDTVNAAFSLPSIIHSNIGFTPEAATPTTDKQKIYYHQRNSNGIFKIFLRCRTITTGINEQMPKETLTAYPNPTNGIVNIELPILSEQFEIAIYSVIGEKLLSTINTKSVDISYFTSGIYFLKVKQDNITWATKIIKY